MIKPYALAQEEMDKRKSVLVNRVSTPCDSWVGTVPEIIPTDVQEVLIGGFNCSKRYTLAQDETDKRKSVLV